MSFFNRKIGLPNVDGIERGKKYYDKVYSEDYPSEKYIPIYKIIISYINSLNIDNINILDVGCGVGEFAKQLQDLDFHTYLGFDFSKNALAQAKNRLPHFSDRFMLHDCYKLAEIDYDYNISVAVEVLEHLDDIKIIKQLKPGSYLVGTLPNFWAANNAHLRIYRNKLTIYMRFRKYLQILKWKKYKINQDAFITIVLFKVK